MRNRLAVLPQYVLPKRALTRMAGRVARVPRGAYTRRLIEAFVRRYRVDLSEAVEPDPGAYPSFNDFFTRALRPGVRPLAQADWVCPVDGAISQLGRIQGQQIVQAKGRRFTSLALLGGEADWAARFDDGHFATLYLSPRDYHRVHMPCAARLQRMVYVPGSLFSVNPTTARGVPGLFARNERVVCLFDTAYGPLALVMVGATIVGSMATVWHGVVNPPRLGRIRCWDYAPGQVELDQGQEMGRFLLGSTVVLLWPALGLEFDSAWVPGAAVRMGQAMAQRA
ncbi:MAG: archaetidylserine decarboxylase [Rhodoferax sp.]